MWRLAAILLGAAALLAQSTHEITGVLVDKATNQGIAGVTVFLQTARTNPAAEFVYPEAVTDGAGRFRFSAVPEGVSTLSVPNARGFQSGFMRTSVSAASGGEVVRFALDRSTEVRGDVIDAETREPVKGLGLFMAPVTYRNGRLIATYRGTRVNTDQAGRFRDSALPNGRYAAHIVPQLWATVSRHSMPFSQEDAAKTDEDYEESYWPGGGGLDAALPQSVAPGVPADFGTMRVRKTTYYRARVRLTPGSCEAAEIFSGVLFRISGQEFIDEAAPVAIGCGRDVLLRGLVGGASYSLSLTLSARTIDQLKYSTLRFTVTNANLDLTAPPAELGGEVEGRVILSEGARSWPSKMRVLVSGRVPSPLELMMQGTARPQTGSVDAEGRFHISNVPPGEKILNIMDLGSAHVIQEVRLGGIRLAESRFDWPSRGSLEIVVDDQPAVITGTVSDGSREANEPLVVLIPWPLTSSRVAVTGDAQGKFQFLGLRAGEYRVLAVPAGAGERLEEPGVLNRLLGRAEKVTLGRGATVKVTVPLLDPGK